MKFSQELAKDSPFRVRQFITGKDAQTLATDILALDQEAFTAAFWKSPMKRVKLAGLRRNAAVVLHNVRNRYLPGTSPIILREGAFRLFFFSREEPRMHVHVAHLDGEAKFWIEPELTASVVVGLSPRQLTEAEDIVRRHLQEVRDAWVDHFGR